MMIATEMTEQARIGSISHPPLRRNSSTLVYQSDIRDVGPRELAGRPILPVLYPINRLDSKFNAKTRPIFRKVINLPTRSQTPITQLPIPGSVPDLSLLLLIPPHHALVKVVEPLFAL